MSIQVIGTGVGRTGTLSLKLALTDLGVGPCYAMQPWLEMAESVITKTGFPPGLSKQELEDRFVAHSKAVQAVIPANRLLMFDVKDGWQPLCGFLRVPTPDGPFPRTNDRESFWKLVRGEAE